MKFIFKCFNFVLVIFAAMTQMIIFAADEYLSTPDILFANSRLY